MILNLGVQTCTNLYNPKKILQFLKFAGTKCELPLCSTKCLDGPNHKLECQVFSQDLPTGLKFKVNFDRPK